MKVSPMRSKLPHNTGYAYIKPEIAFFHRRWQGWRRIVWWLWPIRWALVQEWNNYDVTDYYTSANDAAVAMAKLAHKEHP